MPHARLETTTPQTHCRLLPFVHTFRLQHRAADSAFAANTVAYFRA